MLPGGATASLFCFTRELTDQKTTLAAATLPTHAYLATSNSLIFTLAIFHCFSE